MDDIGVPNRDDRLPLLGHAGRPVLRGEDRQPPGRRGRQPVREQRSALVACPDPQGREILTAGGDGTARIWDETSGRLIQTYRSNSRFLVDATLSPDGSTVVAGGADGLLRFWALQAHKSHVLAIHFEGDDIVTRGFAGNVARWTLPKPEQVIEACNAREAVRGASSDHSRPTRPRIHVRM